MLRLHFLNVGHGDCTFIEHPSGRLSMIDVNNSKSLPEQDVEALALSKGMSVDVFKRKGAFQSSWEDYYRSLLIDPYDYYYKHFRGRSIFRYIQTHPDMDHMSGLHRFFWQEKVTLENFWDTAHNKKKTQADFQGSQRYSYMDWLVYELLRSGVGPDESDHKVFKNLRGDARRYWSDDEVEILSPTSEIIDFANESEEYNNCSYVLRLEHAGRVVILPGDAEGPAWDSIVEEFDEDVLECDILKAAHHGRESGYHEDAVTAMSPRVVVCSVGKKPEVDASDEYASHGAEVFSTRYHGTITVTITDGGQISVCDRNDQEITSL